ncbi:MAG: YraN family protein [Proteobacteria bacterium]|nr:YraN family protein [Pseudomonadota bacterium]
MSLPPSISSRAAGRAAEDLALSFLQSQGLSLIARNQLFRGGELDLIMRDGQQLVFIEVRQRTNARFGGALASVHRQKRRRIGHASRCWLLKTGWKTLPVCRFDVVGLDATGQISWVKAAFSLSDF